MQDSKAPTIDFGPDNGLKKLSISEVSISLILVSIAYYPMPIGFTATYRTNICT
jgi:hypothetical protein